MQWETAGDGSSFSRTFRTPQHVAHVANVKEVATVNQWFKFWGWQEGVSIFGPGE